MNIPDGAAAVHLPHPVWALVVIVFLGAAIWHWVWLKRKLYD